MEQGRSLGDVNQSVNTNISGSRWKKLFAFLGPAYLISVGYMDPGNWATDIAGGSKYGYTLIWVLVMSNLIAILLQSLSARLGIVAGKDLAQASRETYPPFINFILYILAEVAIAACDLAEVIGMAIGINLLFGLPLIWGVCITVLDTFLLLFLLNFGIRKLEAFIICLVAIIGMSFGAEMFFAKPSLAEVAGGIIPSIPTEEALLIAIGIIGATVMPHNLYLHSSLVQTRKFERNDKEIKKAIRFNIIDSVIALNLALFVNAAILILAASSFFKNGMHEVTRIEDAHKFLAPMLGTGLAPILFAVALIAAGQSSTVTGTLAGQIIMEGYLNLRIQPWIRRLLTRFLAIAPAVICLIVLGDSVTEKLLIFSQVILSLQLGFAVIPLIHFVSDKTRMGKFAISVWTKIFSWLAATIIVWLNIKLVFGELSGLINNAENPWLPGLTLIPLCVFFILVLLYITFKPLFSREKRRSFQPHGELQTLTILESPGYRFIGVTVDFSSSDEKAINKAIMLGGKDCRYLLMHIVETPNALIFGKETYDLESEEDAKMLLNYKQQVVDAGYACEVKLGFGNPKKIIPELVNETGCNVLVMGTHGHKGLKDLLLGTTVEAVRHGISVPLMIV
ncbi:MAG: Nramp family divalent metal transporter [Bacteroidia bacterium]